MTIFGICLIVSVVLFMWGVYRFKNYDYLFGFVVGAFVMFLLTMGSAAAGMW